MRLCCIHVYDNYLITYLVRRVWRGDVVYLKVWLWECKKGLEHP